MIIILWVARAGDGWPANRFDLASSLLLLLLLFGSKICVVQHEVVPVLV